MFMCLRKKAILLGVIMAEMTVSVAMSMDPAGASTPFQRDTSSFEEEIVLRPEVKKISPRSFDDQLRESITCHIINNSQLFTQSGLEKIQEFLGELDYFFKGAILLRDDTSSNSKIDSRELKGAILSLLEDYKSLNKIACMRTPTLKVNGHMMEILRSFYDESLSLDHVKMNKYNKQIYFFDIVMEESENYYNSQRKQLPFLLKNNFFAIQSMVHLHEKLHHFISNFYGIMKEIELERRRFDLMLRTVCESPRDIRLKTLIEDFPDLTDLYRQAAATKMAIDAYSEKIKLEQEAKEAAEATVRREAYDKRESEKKGVKRTKKSSGAPTKSLKIRTDLPLISDPSSIRSRGPSKKPSNPPKKVIDSLSTPRDQHKSSAELSGHKLPKKSFFGFGSSTESRDS